ncbi:MAG: integration host factor subunit beta [Chthoniobacterales bacterium]|nr:integration host factor subunit beta [Chthoniobacterales bacterium]MCX7712229.1 integration host factor subunit beta [Chthoniobacterales bacterium]
MPNLTKRDIVINISNELGLVQSDVYAVVQKTFDQIIEALASGRDVELRNFGVFEVRLTKPRVGRNPKQPDKDVPIPPRAIVKFKAGKVMKQRVLMRTKELINTSKK